MRTPLLWALVACRLPPRNLSPRDVEAVVSELAAVVVERAAQGERVLVPGLGVFRARARKARRVVAPNGAHHHIDSHVVLTFRAAKAVRVLRRGE